MPMVKENLQLDQEQWEVNRPQPAVPPHGFILFLERIGLIQATEIPHPYPEPITREKLETADIKGRREVQRIKTDYIDQLIAFRVSPPHRLGTPMKARAQQIIQTMRRGEAFGDPNTWLLDPLDRKSCVAVASYLIKKGHTNFWISGAMTGDFTDPLSSHKNQRMPIFGHDPNEYTINHSPAKNLEELEDYLDCVERFIHDERVEKLTRKITRSQVPNIDQRLAVDQRALMQEYRSQAEALIYMAEHIESVEGSDEGWESVNSYLAEIGQPPLDKHDHALIKLFPQDGMYWQNGDLRIEGESLVLEFPAGQFTHREEATKLESKPKLRFEIKRDDDGTPIIITDYETQPFLPYLYPFLNSKAFWKRFDRYIIPMLGNSPYHQVEFMYQIGYPAKTIKRANLEDGMRVGRVDLIVDIISGIHANNHVETDRQFKNGDRNAKVSRISPLIADIEPLTLEGARIYSPAEYELINNRNFANVLYCLLLKLAPGHPSILGKQPEPIIFGEYNEREIAHALLATSSIWSKNTIMPPSAFRILEDISEHGKTYRLAGRALQMLENQARIAEIPDQSDEVIPYNIGRALRYWLRRLTSRQI